MLKLFKCLSLTSKKFKSNFETLDVVLEQSNVFSGSYFVACVH